MRLWKRDRADSPAVPEGKPAASTIMTSWPTLGDPDGLGIGAPIPEKAVGLPALLGAISRGAHGVGMMPQIVYRGEAPYRERARDTWQWDLLHKRPSSDPGVVPLTFRADTAASLMGDGNAYIRKYKAGGRVLELGVLDPRQVEPKRRADGRVVFTDRTETPAVDRTSDDIIMVRTFQWGSSSRNRLKGISPITAARLLIAAGLGRQQFEALLYKRGVRPGAVLSFPGEIGQEEAEGWIDLFGSKYAGAERSHGIAALGGGATFTPLPVSLEDAQFVEAIRITTQQVGAIYGIPPVFLGDTAQQATDQDWRMLVTFGLGWIYMAIDQAMSADTDLFPQGGDLMVETLADALLRSDAPTRYAAYKDGRQGSWITANEIRAMENLPPVPGGDEILITPVGGAPNPGPAADRQR